jgi:hypothetical protein
MPQGETESVIEPAPGEGRQEPAGRARWRRRLPGFATLAVFAALALYVLASQNRFVGFEPGYDERQPKHHGWVSSHALAIISHATAENGFVGYALAYAGPNGTIRYDYFDRYPVFFSAAMHQALSITERLSSKVYIAKQIMNLIFLATVFFAALIVDKLVGSKPAALAAAVLAMSSEYLLFYKDMVHFDQPALLGMMILVYTLALYRIDGRRRIPYLGTVLAVSMGRGYASFAVLIVWWVIETAGLLKRTGGGWKHSLPWVVRQPATRACMLGLGLGALFLAYNIGVEAIRTETPILRTSIVESAENRLGMDEAFNERHALVIAWDRFIPDQLDRLVRWSVPLRKPGGETLPNLLILAAALAVIARQVSHWDRDRQAVALLLLVPGFVWLIAMRNMSGPHEYTSMYYLGVPLLFYASAFSLLRVSVRPLLGWGMLAAALILFLIANQQTQALHQHLETRSDPVGRLSQFTWDMMAIRERLPREGKIIALSQELPNAPYGLGFYLPDLVRGSLDEADFIIARDPDALPGNLTPENKRLFAFPRPSEP